MRYIDPYELFSIADPAQVDDEALRKLRRRMMAEFELSNDGFLDWRGHAVDKTAATELLDAMADPQTRQDYWAMRQVPGLVAYFASDDLRLINNVQFARLPSKPDFQRFVSAFWAINFDQQLGKTLETAHWPEAIMLLRNTKYLHKDYIDEAFKSAVRKAHVGIVALENAALTPLPALLEFDVTPYTQQGFVNAFNQYPPRFQYLRDAYGKALLAYARISENDRLLLPKAMQAITAACNLGQDAAQRLQCQQYRDRLRWRIDGTRPDQAYREAVASNEKGAGGCRNTGVGLIVILSLILGLRTCIGKLDKPTYTPPPINIKGLLDNSRQYSSPLFTPEKEDPKPAFYRSMNFQTNVYASGNSPCKSRRPETGWSPYKKIFGPPERAERGHVGDFTFHNKSDKDLVLLLEHGRPLEIVASYYVRAKSKLPMQTLPVGNYTFRIYNGSHWCDQFSDYEGQQVGGFAADVDYIGNYKREESTSDAAAPELEDALALRGAAAEKLIFEDGHLHHSRDVVYVY